MVSEVLVHSWWLCCFWARGEAEHHGGKHEVEQNFLPHGRRRERRQSPEIRYALQPQAPVTYFPQLDLTSVWTWQWINPLMKLAPSGSSHLSMIVSTSCESSLYHLSLLGDTSYTTSKRLKVKWFCPRLQNQLVFRIRGQICVTLTPGL
jgi:hypothetical protein